MRKTLILISLLLGCLSPSIQAADLYSGEVPVLDQTLEARRMALPYALGQVLGKLSGQRDLVERPGVAAYLEDAERMLLAFEYRSVRRIADDGSEYIEPRLVAHFSPQEVDRLSQAMGLPFWSPKRNTYRFWAAIDDGSGRRVMPMEYIYAWDAVNDVADARGMGLDWPSPSDETGEYDVDAQLLWGGFAQQLVNQEEGLDGVLIASAWRAGPVWEIRWNMSDGRQEWNWRSREVSLDQAMAEGVHKAIDQLASRDAIAAADLGLRQHEITVENIASAADYQLVLSYLQALSLVNQVNVLQVLPGSVRFDLELRARAHYLDEAVARDQVLTSSPLQGVYQLEP